MPVSKRTGRRYAAGSHATLEDYPRVCSGCGGRVKVTGDEPLLFLWTPEDGKRSWHWPCRSGATAGSGGGSDGV